MPFFEATGTTQRFRLEEYKNKWKAKTPTCFRAKSKSIANTEEIELVVEYSTQEKMIQIQFCLVCLIVVHTAYCAGKSVTWKPKTCDFGTVTTHIYQLYYTTSVAKNTMNTIGKKELPQFFSRWPKKCRGYLNNNKSPFQRSLTRSVNEFKGPKFFPQTIKVFLPFLLAINNVLNETNVPAQAPLNLMDDINMDVIKLLDCLQIVKPNFQAFFPRIRYSGTVHKADVKSCLRKEKVTPTPRKVQLLQYREIMDKLYVTLRRMDNIISAINAG